MSEPQDLAWCPGWGEGLDDWLEECHDCQRRVADGGEMRVADGGEMGSRPPIVALWCEDYVPPDRPDDQRLRELARRLGEDL